MRSYSFLPLDPLVIGDGRPFAQEAGAGKAGGRLIPSPSTLAGAVRASIGRSRPSDRRDWADIERIPVHGPLLEWNGELWIPAPHDMVAGTRGGKPVLARTRPMPLDKMVGVAAPREFADLVMRCLAKDPRARPQSAKEVLQALRECELKPIRRWNEPVAEPD